MVRANGNNGSRRQHLVLSVFAFAHATSAGWKNSTLIFQILFFFQVPPIILLSLRKLADKLRRLRTD